MLWNFGNSSNNQKQPSHFTFLHPFFTFQTRIVNQIDSIFIKTEKKSKTKTAKQRFLSSLFADFCLFVCWGLGLQMDALDGSILSSIPTPLHFSFHHVKRVQLPPQTFR